MHTAIALTLAFFGLVSGIGTYRDLLRAMRDPRPARYLGTVTAVLVTLWRYTRPIGLRLTNTDNN